MNIDNSVLLNILAGLVFVGIVAVHLSNGRLDLSTGLFGIVAIVLLGYGVKWILDKSFS